ncbi:hypothetical protein KGF57_001315 [Candida theae]|uniref:TAFII55 protein conserved region domain-containing protein n=1 Tax=Candida theae TaxID=1198502 RepID=A0AAD5BHC9_9ASCO|nr:uncharacterized protein KGF57_001315 [Candida theae]KAI5963370.1 hypothetical protein KGF57_001315 [Candida theae]
MALKLKLKVRPTDSSTNPPSLRNEEDITTKKAPTESPHIPSKRTVEVKEPNQEEKPKKLKLSLSKSKPTHTSDNVNKPRFVPRVRIKPTRIPGEGYDSEAPDLEDDPLIEQGIVLRFLDDTNLEFVHNAVESGDLTGLNVKWITRDKAVVNVNGTLYSARLIDLPTLVEVYKTVDKKNILKNMDVSQILLVLHTINPTQLNTEKDFEVPDELLFKHPFYDHAKNHEVPRKRYVSRNGVLDPFKDVYRRFRPTRADHRVIQDIEDRVDALIKLDNEAEESHFELVNPSSIPKYGHLSNSPSAAASPYPESVNQRLDKQLRFESEGASESKKQSIQGGINVFETRAEEDNQLNEDDFEINLEEELNKVLDDKDPLADHQVVTVSPEMAEVLQDKGALLEGTYGGDGEASDELLFGEVVDDDGDDDEDDGGQEGLGANDDEEGEEDDEEEDDDEDEDDEEKGHGKGSLSHSKLLEEEITELEKVVEKHKKNLSSTTDTMMKMKLQSNISSLKASLEQKKRDLSKSIVNEETSEKNSVEDRFDAESSSDKTSGSRLKGVEEDAGDDEEAEDVDGSDNNNDSADSIDDLF